MPDLKDNILIEDKDYHNYNCFLYLTALLKEFPARPEQKTILNRLDKYDPKYSYANAYGQLLNDIETRLDDDPQYILKKFFHSNQDQYNAWIHRIYFNENHSLSRIYEGYLKGRLATRRLIDQRPERIVRDALKPGTQTQVSHKATPQAAGSKWGRLMAMISKNFKPMLSTSIPSTRDYEYTRETRSTVEGKQFPQELRFGTQGQRHNGQARVSPMFKEWLRVQEAGPEVNHVYFNLLGYDRTGYEGTKEKNLSLELHRLEKTHPNVMVITLPADKGLMDKHDFEKRAKLDELTGKAVRADFLDIAKGNSKRMYKDFYMSPKAKELLYKGKNEEDILKGLLEKSFKAMDLQDNDKLSPSERQAVWFHFTKFEFPNFVLEKIKPNTWNTSCKDAIDRGGVASAYYNLFNSFELRSPLSRDEFEQGLHAAAAVVKGRGLNHHYEIIWNAVNQSVNHQFETLKDDPKKQWLIHWRNDNIPKKLLEDSDLQRQIIVQNLDMLETVAEDTEPKRKGREVLLVIKEQLFDEKGKPRKTSGKKGVLLEVASHTTQMALEPEKPVLKDMDALCKDLDKQAKYTHISNLFKRFINYITRRFSHRKDPQGANPRDVNRFKDIKESYRLLTSKKDKTEVEYGLFDGKSPK